MTVEISSEAYQTLQSRVEQGQFASIEEALNSSIFEAASLTQGNHDPEYLRYVNESIEAGLADAEAGRLIPLEQFLADMRARRQESA